jgi:hypothetical protein
MFIENHFNCWDIPLGQSAAKLRNEKVQRLAVRRTPKQEEMGEILMGSRYSLICMVTCSSPNRTDKEVASLVEHNVMEELFVAPLHYGFVFFGQQ